MSSPAAPLEARAPKRARGHARVEAILDAAAVVFAEKGFDAATMTEIAARSATAIGSLYRFFPTKTSLADALLARYAETVAEGFAAIEARAAAMTSEMLADALIERMLDTRPDSAAAVALVDLQPDGPNRRAAIRQAAREGIAAALRRRAPRAEGLDEAAAALLQMLKGARPLADAGAGPLAALRTAIRLYVAHVVGEDA
jgi:AcrR family transcriptional regulator